MFDLDLFRKMAELPIGVSQSANAELFDLMGSVCPLTVHRYPSGIEHNGWVVPHNWIVERALIKQKGVTLFDGAVHPLAVAGYSSSFRGTVSRSELDEHLFFNRNFPDAYVWHGMNTYRPWQKHWGFCVPFAVLQHWGDGNFDVELETEFLPGEMLVGEYHHHGERAETVVFNAHTCHPCQANDDLSGVLVILELFRWLRTLKTRYSYRAILAPEHIGTVFYLASRPADDLARVKLGCFTEMVGTDGPFALQQSFTGHSIIDRVAAHVLKGIDSKHRVAPFRTVVGNDETVWEAPGIEVPMISISRWPFPQYHTSDDNLNIISAVRLEESLRVLKEIVNVLEEDHSIQRRFTGLVALSNPKYSLYIERPDPVVAKQLSEADLRLGRIQDHLPRYFDGRHTVFDIAERFDISFSRLREYLERFRDKGLVDLRPVGSLGDYATQRQASQPSSSPGEVKHGE